MSPSVEKLQPLLIANFKRIIQQGQLGQSYILAGQPGTGKSELALWLAQSLFCIEPPEQRPCGHCEACKRIAEGNHPDVLTLAPEGQSIKIDDVRYLKTEFTKSGLESNVRAFIIQDGDKMTPSAANGLLKFLEEPASQVYTFMTTSSVNKLLPTIRSRMQIVQVQTPGKAALVDLLKNSGLTEERARILANLTNNSEAALATNEAPNFEDILIKFWLWFELIAKHDEMAFVVAGTQVAPNLKSKDDQGLFIDLLLFCYHDILSIKYVTQQPLIYTNHVELLTAIASQLTAAKLVDQMNQVLTAQSELTSNVTFQMIIESLSLKLS